jgi:hypothetical protein
MTPEQQRLNAEKSLALASALFPHEKWIPKEANIWVAKSRLAEKYKELDKWEREMSQVQILTGRGVRPTSCLKWKLKGRAGSNVPI